MASYLGTALAERNANWALQTLTHIDTLQLTAWQQLEAFLEPFVESFAELFAESFLEQFAYSNNFVINLSTSFGTTPSDALVLITGIL